MLIKINILISKLLFKNSIVKSESFITSSFLKVTIPLLKLFTTAYSSIQTKGCDSLPDKNKEILLKLCK